MATIEIHGLSKRFGDVTAVDGLSFTAREGAVTGFLGPNGAGKSTTLRMLLGLVTPSDGSATIDGSRYADLHKPFRRVGTMLETDAFHPGRRARDHLRILATAADLPAKRVDAVLEEVDLVDAGHRRVKGFSLGMRQRLGLASALLGDPTVLILDEPANGLDPDGVRWLRQFVRSVRRAEAAPSCSRVTCSQRWRKPLTTSSSSPADDSSPSPPWLTWPTGHARVCEYAHHRSRHCTTP